METLISYLFRKGNQEMIDKTQTDMLGLIRATLWYEKLSDHTVTRDEYEELKRHAIVAIPASAFSELTISPEIKDEWKKSLLQQISYYTQYKYEQTNLPISVPYVVLKGLAAAKYYNHPELRTMGDIDILIRREDYNTACTMLIENGYKEITEQSEEDIGRHRSFIKKNIIVEAHASFALLRDSKSQQILDDMLFQNINDTHYLPDMLNGLVLLCHINQHLAGGLGLRQIIDWMLFVDKCLPDDKWSEFQEIVGKVKLEKLAVTVTQMCITYLGLPIRKWCANADEILCNELMGYVLSCGNFGNKRIGESSKGEGFFAYVKSLGTFFRLLQMRGLFNWRAAKKHVWLRPFAWLYQLRRYLIKGLGRDEAFYKLRNEYTAAKKKNRLLDKLEVKRDSD